MNLQPDNAYKVCIKQKLFLCADLSLTPNISVVACMYVHVPQYKPPSIRYTGNNKYF